MLKVSRECRQKIGDAWGDSMKVADIAFDDLLGGHEDTLRRDYDRDAEYALKIGVLTGEMKNATVRQYISAFEKEILNKMPEESLTASSQQSPPSTVIIVCKC